MVASSTIDAVAPVLVRVSRVGKKPSSKPPGRPSSGRPLSRQVSVRIPPEVEARLRAFIEAQPVPPSETAVILAGLELFLVKQGFPPAREGQ